MCHYQVWFHDEKAGYIVECKHCNKMQLCFGNILMELEKKDFANFCAYISAVQKERTGMGDRQKKCIILSTPCKAISFMLTMEELDGLCRITDYADTEMKTAALISMFTA